MNRIQLLFNRNRDAETTGYRIYRAGLPGVSRNSLLVMEIDQPTDPDWIEIKDEEPVKLSEASYKLNFKHICSDKDKPAILYLDGIEAVYSTSYSIDYEEGIVNFAESVEGRKVTASYFFDGIAVVDDDIYEGRTDIKYHGPSPLDYSPPGISNAVLTGDNDTNSVTLSFQTSSDGENYYYRIEAVDIEGYFSNLCDEKVVRFRSTPIAVIEKSTDSGRTWKEAARTATSSYTETGIDKDKPNPVTKFAIQTSYEGYVYLDWYAPVDTVTTTASPKYRVYTITEAGLTSLKTPPVGPVFIKTPLDKIVVRRKVWNGAYPTYDGNDGTTVATLGPTAQQYMDTLYQKGKHAYAVYVVDKGGNVSVAATAIADMDHATRLSKPIVTANPIDVLYGLEDMPVNVGPYFTYVGMKAGSLTGSGWTIEYTYNDAERDQVVINLFLNGFAQTVSPALNATTGKYEYVLSELSGGTYDWQMSIGDLYNPSSDFSNKFTTYVNIGPQITYLATKSTTMDKGFTIEFDTSDVENDMLTFKLELDGTLSQFTPTYNGTHWEYFMTTSAGSHNYRLFVSDSAHPGGIYSTLRSVVVPANQSPVISNFAVKAGSVGANGFTVEFNCNDPEGDTLLYKYLLDGGLPVPVVPTLNATSGKYEIAFNGQTLGTHTVQVNVSDTSHPAGAMSPIITVICEAAVVSAPSIAVIANQNGNFAVELVSSSTDSLGYSITYDIYMGDNASSVSLVKSGATFSTPVYSLNTNYPIGTAKLFYVIAVDSSNVQTTSNQITATIPGYISKNGSGRIWRWNETDLNQFNYKTPGGTVTVESGTIHFKDTSTIYGTGAITKPMPHLAVLNKFEFQVNTKVSDNTNTLSIYGCAADGSTLTPTSITQGSVGNSQYYSWTPSGNATTTYAPNTKYSNTFVLQKARYTVDRTTPANCTYQYIPDGQAQGVRYEPQITNLTGWNLNTADGMAFEAWAKNIVVCSDWVVTVTGLPLGYQIRIGNYTASEVSGTAKLDGYNIIWGKDLTLQILDPQGAIITNITPAEGIYGGDTFYYGAFTYTTLTDTVFTTDPGLVVTTPTGKIRATYPHSFGYKGKIRQIADFTYSPVAGGGKYAYLDVGVLDTVNNRALTGDIYWGDTTERLQVEQVDWNNVIPIAASVTGGTTLNIYDGKLYRQILEYDTVTGILNGAITKDLTDTSIDTIATADKLTLVTFTTTTGTIPSKFAMEVRNEAAGNGSAIAIDLVNNQINWASNDTSSYKAQGKVKKVACYGWNGDAEYTTSSTPIILWARVKTDSITAGGFTAEYNFQEFSTSTMHISIDGGAWKTITNSYDSVNGNYYYNVSGLSPGRHVWQLWISDATHQGSYSTEVVVNIPIDTDLTQMPDNWAKFGANLKGTGQIQAPTITSPTIAWTAMYPSGFDTTLPAIDGSGNIIVSNQSDWSIDAFDKNGNFLWSYPTDMTPGSVAIDKKGDIYFTQNYRNTPASNGKVICLNPNGTLKWQYELTDGQISTSGITLLPNGTLAYTTDTSAKGTQAVQVLNPLTQTVVWSLDTATVGYYRYNYGEPSVDDDGTLYFQPDSSRNGQPDRPPNRITATDINGNIKWQTINLDPQPNAIGWTHAGLGHVAIGKEAVYVGFYVSGSAGTTKFYIYAINKADGSVKWRWDCPMVLDLGYFWDCTYLGVTGDDMCIFTIEADQAGASVYAVAKNGTLAWEHHETVGKYQFYGVPPTTADGTTYAFLSGTPQKLQAISVTGTVLWEMAMPFPYHDSLIVGKDGTLYVFESETTNARIIAIKQNS